jgi:succinyl-CoA synthetase alpha subunit/succinyl-CoA synthetase beta subunit
MRLFEYEAREVVKRAGIPVTDYGFTTDAAEARQIAERIGGSTVIKSQVLTGGRMKAGGVKFADTPDEAQQHAADILKLEINGHQPRGVLVDPKAEVKQEYYAGVVWDGTRKQPVMIFSPVGGIDIEQVAEEHPDRVGRVHLSNILPLSDFQAKECVAQTGVTGSRLNKLVPILTRLCRLFVQYDMTLAEINPLGELHDGSFIALDAHMDMENEARPRQRALLTALGVGDEETRQAREATPFELAGEEVDAMDHRGVAGNVTEFDGDLGLVIGAGGGSLTLFDAVRNAGGDPANYCEIGGNPSVPQGQGPGQARPPEGGRGQDRGDDVDRLQHPRGHRGPRRRRRLPRARHGPGGEDLDLPHPRGVGGRGLQDPRALRRALRRPLDVPARGGPHGRGGLSHEHPHRRRHDVHRPGHHRPRGGQPHAECLDYGAGAKIVGGVTPGRLGREVHGVPVFDTVKQAVEHHGSPIDGSVVTVPPLFTKDAVIEAIENGIKLIVIVTERIPRADVAQMVELATTARRAHHRPNCLGLIVPDVIKMGGIGGPAKDAAKSYRRGSIGVISASGGMTTEMSSTLSAAGLGISTAVSIGGDAIIGSSYAELMPFFEADEETEGIVIYTEPGGRMEAELARWVTEHDSRLPIVAFMAGRFMDEMPGMSFGHAGTIVEGKEDTASEKIVRLAEAGITVAEEISEIPDIMKAKLAERGATV